MAEEALWRSTLQECETNLASLERKFVARKAMVPENKMKSIRTTLNALEKDLIYYESNPTSFGFLKEQLDNMRRSYNAFDLKFLNFVKEHALVGSRIDKRIVETSNSQMATSHQDIVAMQKQAFQKQDQALDHIGNQVGEIHHLANAVYGEVGASGQLLDSLLDDTENGRRNLTHANAEAVDVLEKSSNWHLWLTIVALLILTVVLLL